jgi:predicted RNA binding protein with dsRBD fold (UPF0201 family)
MSATKVEKEMFEKEKLDEAVERILEIISLNEKRYEENFNSPLQDIYLHKQAAYKNTIRIINETFNTNYPTEREKEK